MELWQSRVRRYDALGPEQRGAEESSVRFQLPLLISSDDGSIRVNQLAHSAVHDEASEIVNAWVEHSDSQPTPKASFAARSGVTGVAFGDVQAASWYTALHLVQPDVESPYGELVINGIDVDGSRSGTREAVLPPIAEFRWSK